MGGRKFEKVREREIEKGAGGRSGKGEDARGEEELEWTRMYGGKQSKAEGKQLYMHRNDQGLRIWSEGKGTERRNRREMQKR